MELIENQLGLTKGTAIEEAVDRNFNGESKEAALYLTMARQSQREGMTDIAQALKTIALEELGHAVRFAELNGIISSSLKENLEESLEGEKKANEGKNHNALKAESDGLDEAQAVFSESSKDEARHAEMIEGLLKKYFS